MATGKVKASIIGATGYVGVELTRLLCMHPEVSLAHLVSQSYAGQSMADVYPAFSGVVEAKLSDAPYEQVAAESDVIFCALPHGASAQVVAQLYESGKVVVDMSADYRYRDADTYAAWYGAAHPRPELLQKSVYGLPELYAKDIATANLIGNPGCYTTCSILALHPLVKAGLVKTNGLIIDAKSGTTGAGRGPKAEFQFCEVNEGLRAYSVAKHRHTSEIEQELSLAAGAPLTVQFTPHLLPVERGIFATCYAPLAGKAAHADLLAAYREAYKDAPFVYLYKEGALPELKNVRGSNFCHIGFVIDGRTNNVVVVSCLDNMVKGAAGQAVQNMNIRFSFAQETGLKTPALCL